MLSAEAQTELLAKRIQTIVDPAMRAAYLRHTMLSMNAAEVADLLIVTRAQAEARSPRHESLHTALCLALADELCAALREAVSTLLDVRFQHALARSLRQHAPGEEEVQVPDFGMGRPVTLGERKSLARRRDRELIARVIRDPHPDVIRILLLNPRVTENDVLRLCARRPVSSDALREVFRCDRWIVRYAIRVALILNPYTPLDVALQLAPLLHDQDLRRVLEAGDLPSELHDACQRRAEQGAVH